MLKERMAGRKDGDLLKELKRKEEELLSLASIEARPPTSRSAWRGVPLRPWARRVAHGCGCCAENVQALSSLLRGYFPDGRLQQDGLHRMR